jgi:hypothetical protein
MPLHQENLPQHSESQAGTPPEAPDASRLSGKLLLVSSVIGAIALLFAATHFSAIRSAWAGLASKPESLSAPSRIQTPASVQHTSEAVPSAASSQPASLSPEEQAQRIWTEFVKASWGVTPEEWSKQHPEIPCQRFSGTMWNPVADAAWSQRCSPGTQPEDAHWSFYAFGLEEPIVPRLEQFDASTASLPTDSLTAVHASLQSKLTARFGPGEDTSQKIVRTADPTSPPNLRWQAPDLEIQLFQSELDPQRKLGRLRLQARGRPLLDALKQDEHLKQFGTGGFVYQAGSGMDAQLSEKLKSEFPGPAAMLMKQSPDIDPQKVKDALEQWKQQFRASQAAGQSGVRAAVIAIPQSNWNADEFEEAIVRLLAAARSAPSDRQPILLLAADRLAGRLPWVVGNDKSVVNHWAEWRAQLGELGVTYVGSGASPDASLWSYTGSILKRVAADYSQSEWGEHAFALLLAQGFDTGVDCAAGSDQFRTVIPQGLQFLEKHPNSPYRLDVQIAVAQAYETWWSLSQAPTRTESEDDYSTVEAAKYQEGAAAARQRAIAAYEALVQSSPQSDHAFYARRQLPRLKLSEDTGQRRYYCEVGD